MRRQPYWVIPKEAQCGVKNGYRNPAQLGSDRWAALIGARALHGARPVLVVCCGTATTIDLLTAQGQFAGGCILPGVGTMLRSLHEKTAALPDADGRVHRISGADRRCHRQRLPARAGRGGGTHLRSVSARSSGSAVPGLGGAAKALTPHLCHRVPLPRQPGARGTALHQPGAHAKGVRRSCLACKGLDAMRLLFFILMLANATFFAYAWFGPGAQGRR